MTTSNWALVISLTSLLISIGSFAWNIWSKFIFPKASLQVAFAVIRVVPEPHPPAKYVRINVTNHGPGDVIVDVAVVKIRTSRFERDGWGLLNPIHDLANPGFGMGPFAGGLPKKLAVAESFSLFFPYTRDMFLCEPVARVGVQDSFGRSHWAPRSQLRKVLRKYAEDWKSNVAE